MAPTTRTSTSQLVSSERSVNSCSGISVFVETIPAPWRLSMTVVVRSEKKRPSASLPMRRMGTCLGTRPLRRRPCLFILATWGRGQDFCSHQHIPRMDSEGEEKLEVLPEEKERK